MDRIYFFLFLDILYIEMFFSDTGAKASELFFMLNCCGLCLETGVQTVPAVDAGFVLLKIHLCALGQAHAGQEEVSCETQVPVTSSLPPAFTLSCFVSFLVSQSGRTKIFEYLVLFRFPAHGHQSQSSQTPLGH